MIPQDLDSGLRAKLEAVEKFLGWSLIYTSGLRTSEQNAAVGGVDGSAHVGGKAVDIACLSGRERYQLVAAALKMGFARIGIGRTFVHFDVDGSKPQDVLWHYYPDTTKR